MSVAEAKLISSELEDFDETSDTRDEIAASVAAPSSVTPAAVAVVFRTCIVDITCWAVFSTLRAVALSVVS